MKNKYKCPLKIWKKFNDSEKEKYNGLMYLLSWKELYHTSIKDDLEIINVTAHNISCQIIWNGHMVK
jgi:hypothetical protein